MAIVITNANVSIGGVDLSSHITKVTLSTTRAEIETTTFGNTAVRRVAGLADSSVAIDFNQDFAATKVAATLDGQIGLGTTAIVIKPTSAATSATNPSYSIANAFLAGTQPVAGSVGDLAQMSASFQGGTMTKATS